MEKKINSIKGNFKGKTFFFDHRKFHPHFCSAVECGHDITHTFMQSKGVWVCSGGFYLLNLQEKAL